MRYLQILFIAALFITSCSKDNENEELTAELAPQIQLSVTTEQIEMTPGDELAITAVSSNEREVAHQWKLNNAVISETNQFSFTANEEGIFTVLYTAKNNAGEFSKTYTIAVGVTIRPITKESSKYLSKVFEYLPAPGQHMNKPTVGSYEQALKTVGSISNFVSLGAYGGYIIFGFDHSVINNEEHDLAIYGNPSGPPSHFSEPGIVMVSRDVNGNGLPDDEWYELAGSEYNKPTTIKNYEITYYNPKGYANVPWEDNQGRQGVVEINTFNKQEYYPKFIANQESVTFKGTLLPSSWGQNGSLWINSPFEWGYTDSFSTGDGYHGTTRPYNSFDISWAVDKDGNSVDLKFIDFVKVYTGQNEKGNAMLGEISTEFKGAVDLGIK